MNLITLQKHYQAISLIFILILFTSFFLWPEKSTLTTFAILLLSFGMSLALIIQHYRERNLQGDLSRSMITRKIALEALILLAIVLAASFAGRVVGGWAGSAVEQLQPGFGLYAGMVASMASALAAGWGMRKMWVKAVMKVTGG